MKNYNTSYKRESLKVRAATAREAREVAGRRFGAAPEDVIAILCAVDERSLEVMAMAA